MRVTEAFKLLTALVHVTDGLGDGDGTINTASFLKLRPLCISRINAWTCYVGTAAPDLQSTQAHFSV